MNAKKRKMSGLGAPRFALFIRGFWDGRTGAAAVDQELGFLNSAYVHGRLFRYGEFCDENVIWLEKELAAVRTEAMIKMAELSELGIPELPDENTTVPARGAYQLPVTAAEARECRRTAELAEQERKLREETEEKRKDAMARKGEIIHRLIEIKNKIETRERIVDKELSSAAEALRSRMCSYCHGAVLSPVYARYIPAVEYSSHLGSYLRDHEFLCRKIDEALREVI